jgi:hypothetical protein
MFTTTVALVLEGDGRAARTSDSAEVAALHTLEVQDCPYATDAQRKEIASGTSLKIFNIFSPII